MKLKTNSKRKPLFDHYWLFADPFFKSIFFFPRAQHLYLIRIHEFFFANKLSCWLCLLSLEYLRICILLCCVVLCWIHGWNFGIYLLFLHLELVNTSSFFSHNGFISCAYATQTDQSTNPNQTQIKNSNVRSCAYKTGIIKQQRQRN